MESRSTSWLVAGAVVVVLAGRYPSLQTHGTLDEQLHAAAGRGDVAGAAALLAKGANVNADNGHGITPLYVACDRANLALATLLVEKGAELDTQDLQWGKTPLRVTIAPWSDVKDDQARKAIVKLLLDKGAGAEGDALPDLIRRGYVEEATAIVRRGGASRSFLNLALDTAQRAKLKPLVDLLVKAGATVPGPEDSAQSPERLALLTGVYRNQAGRELTLLPGLHEDELILQRSDRTRATLIPADLTLIRTQDMQTVFWVKADRQTPSEMQVRESGRVDMYKRVADLPTQTATRAARAPESPAPRSGQPTPRPGAAASTAAAVARGGRDWPSFRGAGAAGIADGMRPPTTWDAVKGVNIKWKTELPGLSHSSPIVAGNRVFVTTAEPLGDAQLTFRYGDDLRDGAIASTKDTVRHAWRVYALDKDSGKIVWQKTASEGLPKGDRHVMQSQADATPATDGTHLVVFFGSEGLYCYDLNGTLLWKRDLGVLRSGRLLDASYEWSTASSPIIYKNLVILQVDVMKDSFIAAFDIKTGRDVWRTPRPDEVPSWATPVIYEGPPRTELITAAPKFTRSYDPDTGKEFWRLGKHSDFSTPTPVVGNGLVFITSGSGNTVQPIYAIRPGGQGDITLKEDEESNEHVAWSKHRGGAFIPTPVFYKDLLYVAGSTGILAVYQAETGERLYQDRLTRGGSYSASGVAADDKLYFASEDGDVIVIKAGSTFEKLAQNPMGEVLMATPAISDGMIIIRTQRHVVAVAEAAGNR